jgi:hypothetical protein
MAPYCVLGDQIVAVRPPSYSRGDCVPPRARVGRSAGTVDAPTARLRSWGLVLAKTA